MGYDKTNCERRRWLMYLDNFVFLPGLSFSSITHNTGQTNEWLNNRGTRNGKPLAKTW